MEIPAGIWRFAKNGRDATRRNQREAARVGNDRRVFAALESPLLGYALRYTGELALAEDVVQEAFMKLHAQFEPVEKPRQWLYRTVHNLALNQRRAAGKTVSLDQYSEEENSAAADTADPRRCRTNKSSGSKASAWCG